MRDLPFPERIVVALNTTISFEHVNALCELGFTEIEALVYAYLAQGGPATGYRISHAIGKPTANTYKAIATLGQQGAVQVDEGANEGNNTTFSPLRVRRLLRPDLQVTNITAPATVSTAPSSVFTAPATVFSVPATVSTATVRRSNFSS